MQFTNKADYALRAMVYLAVQSDGAGNGSWVFTKDIADSEGIPVKFLAQIVRDLRRAGLVEASRGPQGGVKLGYKAGDISVKEIIEAIEGPMSLLPCLTRPKACGVADECPIKNTVAEAQESLCHVLGNTSLQKLSERQEAAH